MKKPDLKIHYSTSDGTMFTNEEEALVHETNLFLVNLAVERNTTFDVAAYLYDADMPSATDLEEVGYWSIHSADMAKEEDYFVKKLYPLGIVQGTLANAIAHALTKPKFRYGTRLGTVKKIDIPSV